VELSGAQAHGRLHDRRMPRLERRPSPRIRDDGIR
jgi:hypothetical protein